jgi:hypothetical protein
MLELIYLGVTEPREEEAEEETSIDEEDED